MAVMYRLALSGKIKPPGACAIEISYFKILCFNLIMNKQTLKLI